MWQQCDCTNALLGQMVTLQVKMEMAAASGMVAPLDATPSEQGMDVTPEGGKKNKSGGPRRKVGRWSEEETNTLILLTNQVSSIKHAEHLCCNIRLDYL